MGKRKGAGHADEESPRKKHKKNKHKKRKTREDVACEETEAAEERVMEVEAAPGGRPLTLKIKLGGKPVPTAASSDLDDTSSVGESESRVAESSVGGAELGEWPPSDPSLLEEAEGEVAVERDSEGEEAAWLDAMEMGQLDERGYLPRKNVTTLTARQRAMLGSTENQLLELPVGKVAKEMTEEMMLKKTEKNRKRRLAAQRRKERRKAETVRKLLEKQNKKKEEEKPAPLSKSALPSIHYVSSVHGSTLSVPHGQEFLLLPQIPKKPPSIQTCSVEGCGNLRRYCDSATRLPLCSLECYRTLQSQQLSANATCS